MFIVSISGGLGNQLFQLSFAYSLKYRLGNEIKLDISFFDQQEKGIPRLYRYIRQISKRKFYFHNLKDFNISTSEDLCSILYPNCKIKQLFFKIIDFFLGTWILTGLINNPIIISENNYDIFSIPPLSLQNHLFRGYWQNHKYYNNFENEIRLKMFLLLEDKLKIPSPQFNSEDTCVIHIRRSDQAALLSRSIYELINLDYVRDSINLLKEKNIKIKKILICSDDIPWCKKNITIINGITKIEFAESSSHWDDFSTMFNSKYLIISNSTFSWWAGYLDNKKVVVMPRKWYTKDNTAFGFIPDSWFNA